MKKEKKEKQPKEKSLKKVKENKKRFQFFTKKKKKWLISRTNTILLIAILIAIFILINSLVAYFDFTPIDLTVDQTYTLTEESKERISGVDTQVNIYFVGWEESSPEIELAKQYGKSNSNINVEVIDANENLEIANKYDVTNDSYSIIVEAGDVSQIIGYDEIVTYDSDGNYVYLIEQKLTSAILTVTSGYIPKVYFLTGYSDLTFDNGLYYLAQNYLEDEVLEYEELNILVTQEIPEDCDTLVIITPISDFDDQTTDAILEYIQKGGNILWLNGAYLEDTELENVNRILAEYGIDGFSTGYIYETDDANIMSGLPSFFIPEVQYTDITSDVYNGQGALFLYSTKINLNDDRIEELGIEMTELVSSSDTTYFTTDLSGNTNPSEDEEGGFVLGAELVKNITAESEDTDETEESSEEDTTDEEDITSTLIIYGNDYFASDMQISYNMYPLVMYYNNPDLFLNSLAYLTENDVNITIRKPYSSSGTEFSITDGDKEIILKIIFIVPVIIIGVGIIIWVSRIRKMK